MTKPDPAKPGPKRAARPGFLDFSHPFYRPLWVRAAVVGLSLGWAAVEAWRGSPGWALIFGAAGAVALWGLFLTYDPDAGKAADPARKGPEKP